MTKKAISALTLALCAGAGCDASVPSGSGPPPSDRAASSQTYAGTAVESPMPAKLGEVDNDDRRRNAYSETPGTGPAHAIPTATKLNPMAAGNASR